MAMQVCLGAMLKCSFGIAPSSLIVLPQNRVMAGPLPAANIIDNKHMVNILPFGMCQSLANPAVASATSAALGVLTPMPCVPVTPAPWAVGTPTVLVGGVPALDDSSKLICMWGGVIEVTSPGQLTLQIP
jgi:hypothetical protein